MLLRSTQFRLLLALIVAVWPSVCLCHAGECEREDEPGCCEASQDGEAPDGHGDRPGCPPGHHERGPGCNCQQLAAPPVKADATPAASIGPVCDMAFPPASDWPVVRSQANYRPRDFRPPPGTAMTLLRLHCALIV